VSEVAMLELKKTTQFRKDLKRVVKRGLNIDLLDGFESPRLSAYRFARAR